MPLRSSSSGSRIDPSLRPGDCLCNAQGMAKGVLIALEGLEGVGKTTLGVRVADALDAEYVKSPPAELNSVRGYVAELRDPRVNFYFYLAGLFAIQLRIAAALAAGRSVIVDRYLSSTIAYHDEGRSFAAPPFDDAAFRQPDVAICVTCPEPLRLERVRRRGLHIYERAIVDEAAIGRFLAERSDVIFVNDGDLDDAVGRLCAIVVHSLGEDE